MRKFVIIALILVAVVGGLWWASIARAPKAPPPTTQERWDAEGVPVEVAKIVTGDMEQVVEVTGNISALDQVTLSSKIAGRIASINVREGDRVSAGQVLVTLDQDDALRQLESAREGLQGAIARLSQARTSANVTKIQTDSAIEQAQAALKSAQARLAVAKNPARNQDVMVAENRVAAAQATLDNKEADYKRNKTLVDKGAISQATYELAETQYTIAKTDLKSAQDQLDLIKEGGRSEDVISAQAAVDTADQGLRTAKANAAQNMLRAEDVKSAISAVGQATAAVELAKQQLSYTYIKAPISGLISSRTADSGQVVSPGQALLGLMNMGSVYFKGDVSEKALAGVSIGQRVRVKVDAIPDREFAGTVAEIYPSGSEVNRNFTVRIAITGKHEMVKPGMFARGEIVTGLSANVMLVPKDAIDDRKGTASVFTLEPKSIVKRHIIQVVRENNEYALLAPGNDLEVGDTVVTQGRQNLNDGLKVKVSGGK